jgi:hypothetical protein
MYDYYEVIKCDYQGKEERCQKTIPANKVLTWYLVILVGFFVSLCRRRLFTSFQEQGSR